MKRRLPVCRSQSTTTTVIIWERNEWGAGRKHSQLECRKIWSGKMSEKCLITINFNAEKHWTCHKSARNSWRCMKRLFWLISYLKFYLGFMFLTKNSTPVRLWSAQSSLGKWESFLRTAHAVRAWRWSISACETAIFSRRSRLGAGHGSDIDIGLCSNWYVPSQQICPKNHWSTSDCYCDGIYVLPCDISVVMVHIYFHGTYLLWWEISISMGHIYSYRANIWYCANSSPSKRVPGIRRARALAGQRHKVVGAQGRKLLATPA